MVYVETGINHCGGFEMEANEIKIRLQYHEARECLGGVLPECWDIEVDYRSAPDYVQKLYPASRHTGHIRIGTLPEGIAVGKVCWRSEFRSANCFPAEVLNGVLDCIRAHARTTTIYPQVEEKLRRIGGQIGIEGLV